jgi:hypothetical protein
MQRLEPQKPVLAWVWVALFAALTVFSVSTIVFLVTILEQNETRCFQTYGQLTLPDPTPNGGYGTGKIEVEHRTSSIDISWQIPSNYTSPSRISLHGPCEETGVGVNLTCPYALTFCGGPLTETCENLEAETCRKHSRPFHCGFIQTTVFMLDEDDVALDVQFFNITALCKKLKLQPQLFYISLENDGLGDIQRGGIGGQC